MFKTCMTIQKTKGFTNMCSQSTAICMGVINTQFWMSTIPQERKGKVAWKSKMLRFDKISTGNLGIQYINIFHMLEIVQSDQQHIYTYLSSEGSFNDEFVGQMSY